MTTTCKNAVVLPGEGPLSGERVSSFFRVARNELAKGYYPTFPEDVAWIRALLDVRWTYQPWTRVAVLDPCAGEGAFLDAVRRTLLARTRPAEGERRRTEVAAYAVEIDPVRAGRIRNCRQVLCADFFDVRAEGLFDLVLLNPPYHRGDLVLDWLDRATQVLARTGVVVWIIPERDWRRAEVSRFVAEHLALLGLWRSARYEVFGQVVAFLGGASHRRDGTDGWRGPAIADGADEPREVPAADPPDPGNAGRWTEVPPEWRPFPVLGLRRWPQGLREEVTRTLDDAVEEACRVLYPAGLEERVEPAITLRKAHAVQLAALGSETAGVEVNGERYLARYWVRVREETYEEPEADGYTVVRRPVVEPVFLRGDGALLSAREVAPDGSLELREDLMEVLVGRLQVRFRARHEVGASDGFADGVLAPMGLLAPQREAVKAVLKAFRAGERGVIVRAPTGSGKTWVARGVIQALDLVRERPGPKRVLFITEAHLPAQIAAEYRGIGLPVRILDSVAALKRWCRGRETPEGVYVISYARFRQHPKPVACLIRRACRVGEEGEEGVWRRDVPCCPDCWSPIGREDRPRKYERRSCPECGKPLWTYAPEGSERERASYGAWVRAIEEGKAPVRRRRVQFPYVRWLQRVPWDLVVADEAHNAANAASNQGSAFLRILSKVPRALALTATVANGYAKSWFNLLWGVAPKAMERQGFGRGDVTRFQQVYGAVKEIHRMDTSNRHRTVERVRTADAPGISPAVLPLILPNLVTMDGEDFTDMPPVVRQVVDVEPHPAVAEVVREIDRILTGVPEDLRFHVGALRAAAYLRAPDTFAHGDDRLVLCGEHLGTVRRVDVGDELLPKERALVENVAEALGRGERTLVFLDSTQKIDLRPVLADILRRELGIDVDVLTDNVPAGKLVAWFEAARAPVAVVGYKRAGTGLNLSQYTNVCWYQGSTNPRAIDQGEGRVRRVTSAMLHRRWWGEVRPVRYTYFVCGEAQKMLLAYTTEKRMVSKLSEGEVPEIDVDELGGVVGQSFAAVLTRALQTGRFEYQDPSVLLRRMAAEENRRLETKVVPSPGPTLGLFGLF